VSTVLKTDLIDKDGVIQGESVIPTLEEKDGRLARLVFWNGDQAMSNAMTLQGLSRPYRPRRARQYFRRACSRR
jgi:hypothetical protein